MITKIIEQLRSRDFYGKGNNINIAKGCNELVTDWSSVKRKIKRSWLRKR